MGLEDDFKAYALEQLFETNILPQSELATDEKLNLLGLYKQAKMGDVNVPRPGAFDIKGRAKHDTWVKQKGKSQEDAMKEYVELVQALKEKYVK